MSASSMKQEFSVSRILPVVMSAVTLLLASAAQAASPGIKGASFALTANPAFISQPDGNYVYSWGYGCVASPAVGAFAPAMANATPSCSTMQIPGPTLIVTAPATGTATVTVSLTNNLPAAAGNTSILFPGFQVSTSGGVTGLLTQEATPAGATKTVTYTLTIPSTAAGTHSYYSGTQGDLQVEMGLYGAIIVLPNPANIPPVCSAGLPAANPGGNADAKSNAGEDDFRLAAAAYNHPGACYDREYLFQFSQMDPRIHREAEEQAVRSCTGCMNVATEPYVPAYFMVNGRSMPDDMDPNYALEYPHQPYNGNPHMHPGELTLLRIIGHDNWQHPFHEHGNHVRVLARDGNLILSATNPATNLAGPLLFTTTTTPGQAMDGIFQWTGKGVNWDVYGHNAVSGSTLPCTADANGYNTGAPTAINYFEWCQDHEKPLQKSPFGDVAGGGPVTLPDPNIFANGPWFGGSPYLGPEATLRAVGSTGTTPPSGTVANAPDSEAGFAFMWHSHNEREITTNNIFPGGMMMMMLVDSREFVIDEAN
jgi:FtsP/CotA-like multicopper oxidase with cupredoxin domain